VRAENDFYESILQDASARIIDLWKSQQPALLDEELGRFAADYLDATAEALAPRLPVFLEATRQAWAARDQEYQSLLAETLRTLTDSRRKLEVEQAKIAELRNKLQPLGEVASDREMLKILIGFARETRAKLDELKAATPPPAGGGTK
jgi:Cdc6-like AAA superfamily ATPase